MGNLLLELNAYGLSPTLVVVSVFLWRLERRLTILETRVQLSAKGNHYGK